MDSTDSASKYLKLMHYGAQGDCWYLLNLVNSYERLQKEHYRCCVVNSVEQQQH